MSSLYFFSSLWRLLVVLCLRVPLYKNMYQRNLQQHLINTYFVIISGCWADKHKWPKHPNALGWAVFIVKNSQARARPAKLGQYTALWQPRKKNPDSWHWDSYAVYWGNHCPLSCHDQDEGTMLKWHSKTLALAWWSLLASCSLVWQGSRGPSCTNPVPAVKSAIFQEALVCFSEKCYFPGSLWVLEINIVSRPFSGQN